MSHVHETEVANGVVIEYEMDGPPCHGKEQAPGIPVLCTDAGTVPHVADRWLKCELMQGMFSTEAAIMVKHANGDEHWYWARIEAVEPRPKDKMQIKGKVKGRLSYDKTGWPWMQLPVAEYTCVPVRKEDIL